MCGVCGFSLRDTDKPVDLERLQRMTRSLIHRGPDDEGLEGRAGVGLGFRRLSIIDLQGGHQPLWNETRDIAVLCNGEIYNFEELRRELEGRGHRFRSHSDVEVIVHLYEEEGAGLLDRLLGMYAICIADFRGSAHPRILLARDRIGIKPLYWSLNAEGLYWGSEPKAILAADALSRDLRAEGLVDYFVQGFGSGPDSIWDGLKRLEPGCVLEWDGGQEVHLRRYWELPLEGQRQEVESAEILEWLDRAVQDRMLADVPLGAFLSGGIDSSAVLTTMARVRGAGVEACTVGFHERSHDELDTARETARLLGLEHHSTVLEADPVHALESLPWFFDEPLADSSTVPTWLVSCMAREHVTVALSGDGGDEVFAGYRRQVFDVAENRVRSMLGSPGCRLARWAGEFYPKLAWAPRVLRARSVLQNIGREPGRAYYASMTQVERAELLQILNPDLRDSIAAYDPFQNFAEHYQRPSGCDPLYRAQYADFKTWLPDRILLKTDRASMAASLEVRVPLLDHRFVERFVQLSTRHKVRHGRGKHALREALRPRIRSAVLDGQKRGFDTPLQRWTRGPLAPAIRTAIEECSDEVFDRGALRTRLAAHQRGTQDHSQLLWSLLIWERWRERHRAGSLIP